MEPAPEVLPRREGLRGAYREYRAARGGLAIPRATWYDITRRRERNRNGVPLDVNVRQNVPLDRAAVNVQAADRPNNQGVEANLQDEGQGALHEGGEEVGADGDGEGDNVGDMPFGAELIHLGNGFDENYGMDDLTVGDKNIERDEDLEETLRPQLQRTKFETLLLVLNFAIRHGLSGVAIEDLLSMINLITGSNLPDTRHCFQKVFASDMEFKYHMYCPHCLVYIAEITEELKAAKTAECRNPECRKQVKVPGMNGKDFFVTLPLGSQIADMLQNMEDILPQLNYRWGREPSENIRDVYDAEVYKNLMKEGNFLSHRYNLSLTFSTDGAAVFKSGCTTMWPIFFRLNELRPEIRFDGSNTMLAGLWFGEKEPPMAMYFNQFLGECRDLYERGIIWKSPDGQIIKSKIITLNCVLDSGAKYMLQATKKFNGTQSCPYCDHPSVTYADNNMSKWPMNHQRVTFIDLGFSYSIRKFERELHENVTYDVYDRTNEDMRRDMEIAEARRRREPAFTGYKGLKSISPMCVLPFFDVCLGFQIDYMHNVLIGNCKHLAKLWIDSSSNGLDFYIGLRVAEINERLSAINPPSSISRRPRPICQMGDWHANEWRSWLLFYSLPCLKGILPAVYYKHFCVLVSSLHILLGVNITKEDLDSVAEHLADFVTEFEVLYGGEHMFFNVHLLLHIPKCVLYWGPLWCYSMFSFESANNSVMKLVKGSTGVASQIVSKYSVSKFLPHLMKVYTISDAVGKFCSALNSYTRHARASNSGGVTLLGDPGIQPLTDEERQAFAVNGMRPTADYYNQMIKDGIKFHSRLYNRRRERSDDSVVRLNDGSYATIIRIIRQEDGEVFLLLKKLNTQRGFITFHNATGAKARHIKVCPQNVYGNLFFRNARECVAKSILMELPTQSYITDFPNTIEKD